MSSAVFGFVRAVCKRLQKVPRENSGIFRPILMIQLPFYSPCVALQYEPGTKFFCRAIPEIHGI